MENLAAPKPNTTHWVHDVPSYTAIVDKDLNLVDASMGWFKHSNLNREQAIGKCIYELTQGFDESWEDSFEYALEGISNIKLTNKYANPDCANGFIWHLNPWKDGYGNTIGLVITIKEEKKRRKQAVEDTSLKAIFENNKDSIIASWEYRLDENQMFWSHEFRNLLGLPMSVNPTLRKSFSFLSNANEKAKLNIAIRDAITSGKPWDLNLRVKDHKGQSHKLNLIGRPKFKNGRCTRILGVLQKINLQNQAPRKKENQYDKAHFDFFDTVPTCLALIDLKAQSIVKVNNRMLGFFGKAKGFFAGKRFDDFVILDREVKTVIAESLKMRFGFDNIEIKIVNRSLGSYSLNVSGNLITDHGGKELLLVACNDMTRSSEVEKRFSGSLKQANEEIEKLVHFAHMVSHDLRAHTTNLDLLLNFLDTEENREEQKGLIRMLFQSTSNLTSTIRGLRDLVTIKHQEHAKKKNLNFSDYVNKVIQSCNGIIMKKNAIVRNEVSEEATVRAIPAYLESILVNLMLTCLHFLNENDRPVLILHIEKKDKHVMFSIEDNSMGINLEKEGDNVFEVYKKLKNMGSSSSIGLYLTKYQIELMGGRIEVESAEGEGNLFRIYFPT